MPKVVPNRKSPPSSVPLDSLPDAGENTDRDEARGGHPLAPDGGNQNHPIHDDDPSEDFTARDYEEQIDKVADSRKDQRKRADVEEK